MESVYACESKARSTPDDILSPKAAGHLTFTKYNSCLALATVTSCQTMARHPAERFVPSYIQRK